MLLLVLDLLAAAVCTYIRKGGMKRRENCVKMGLDVGFALEKSTTRRGEGGGRGRRSGLEDVSLLVIAKPNHFSPALAGLSAFP